MRTSRFLSSLVAGVAMAFAVSSGASASTTVTWTGSSSFNDASVTFAGFTANQLTGIGGSGTYDGVFWQPTSFSLLIDLNGAWTDVLDWSVAKYDNNNYSLSSLLTSPISFSTGTVTGIKLTSAPDGPYYDPNYNSFVSWCFEDCWHQDGETFTFTNSTTGGGGQDTTPLPAAVWMFGSVLAGAGGLQTWRGRRKSRVNRAAAD
jgi:hypothetical protein